MVDVLGHLGMALLWLTPAWIVLDRSRTAVTFVATGVWFGLLPDSDLVLSNWFPRLIHHHGVFHTLLVVTVLAALLGPIVGRILTTVLRGTAWFSPQAENNASEVGFLAVWIPGLSHLFVDMLSASDVAPPLEPLWPLYGGEIVHVDVFYYTSFWATWGLFVAGSVLNGVLLAWKSTR